jgi:hypothetical protein
VGEAAVYDISALVRCPAGRLPLDLGKGYPAGHAASWDPEASLKKVRWDFGDGARETGTAVRHVYENAGRYTVHVTVTGPQGGEHVLEFAAVAE